MSARKSFGIGRDTPISLISLHGLQLLWSLCDTPITEVLHCFELPSMVEALMMSSISGRLSPSAAAEAAGSAEAPFVAISQKMKYFFRNHKNSNFVEVLSH